MEDIRLEPFQAGRSNEEVKEEKKEEGEPLTVETTFDPPLATISVQDYLGYKPITCGLGDALLLWTTGKAFLPLPGTTAPKRNPLMPLLLRCRGIGSS